MAKIGTAHVEIKPVISDEVLEAITARIADAVADGVERGMAADRPVVINQHIATDREVTPEEIAAEINRLGRREHLA